MKRNKLNDLTGKEWIQETKSWFHASGNSRTKLQKQHPGKFPESIAKKYITFFTKQGMNVFDPFLGTGTTVFEAEKLGRVGYGIELNPDFIDDRKHKNIFIGDSSVEYKKIKKDSIDLLLTSPPYWNILKKTRGNSDSQHSSRKKDSLPLYYSENKQDLGNIDNYDEFLKCLKNIMKKAISRVKPGGHIVIIAQNFLDKENGYTTFAWDIVKILNDKKTKFLGEQIWLQNDKKLGIWGMGASFVSNVHHHYALIFKKELK